MNRDNIYNTTHAQHVLQVTEAVRLRAAGCDRGSNISAVLLVSKRWLFL